MTRRALTLLVCLSLASCSGTWWSARGRDAGQVAQLGLGASLYWDTPGGPSIVAGLAILVVLAWAVPRRVKFL